MTRILLDYGAFSVWLISLKDTALGFIGEGEINSVHLILSILGGCYTFVLIVNKILDGRINRKKTHLENEMLKREIWEIDEDEDIYSKYEGDK